MAQTRSDGIVLNRGVEEHQLGEGPDLWSEKEGKLWSMHGSMGETTCNSYFTLTKPWTKHNAMTTSSRTPLDCK